MSDIMFPPNDKFVAHVNGNANLYGINTFGCSESYIMFKDDPEVWRFYSFSSNHAKYVNRYGAVKTIACKYSDDITRMQIKDGQ